MGKKKGGSAQIAFFIQKSGENLKPVKYLINTSYLGNKRLFEIDLGIAQRHRVDKP